MLNKLTKLREERAEGDKGFTLIELLVVVVIIGILIAIAIPLYLNYQKGAKNKSAAADVRNAITAVEQCNSDAGSIPGTMSTNGTLTAGTHVCDTPIKWSSGNSLHFAKNTTGGTVTYTITDKPASPGDKTACYDSAKGGSVSTANTSVATGVACS